MTEDEDGHGDTAVAQLGGLIDAGHGQIVRAQRLQGAGHLHRAVAVGIGLDHAQKFDVLPYPLPQSAVVIGQGVQVDLRPRSLQCGFHNNYPSVWQVKDSIFTVSTTCPFCENSP